MKKRFLLIFFITLLICACSSQDDAEPARQALISFFDQLAAGDYTAAVEQYGGSYNTLVEFNPELDPNDYPALWQNGCQINGLQCLTVRSALLGEPMTAGEYVFTVEFNNPDGSLFELGACCGETAETPSTSQFAIRVAKDENGRFCVLDLPVYVP